MKLLNYFTNTGQHLTSAYTSSYKTKEKKEKNMQMKTISTSIPACLFFKTYTLGQPKHDKRFNVKIYRDLVNGIS